jgi:hypothetical protein
MNLFSRDAAFEVNRAEMLVVRVPSLRVVESVDLLDEITRNVVDITPARVALQLEEAMEQGLGCLVEVPLEVAAQP